MTLTHQVKLKRPFGDSGDDLAAWCLSHVGHRYATWHREIAHMDYETGLYTWAYYFRTPESAAVFAITHA